MLLRFSCVSLLTVTGCQEAIRGPVDVEILVTDPSASSGFRLKNVELQSVVDLNTGAGTLFDVVGDFDIDVAGLQDALTEDDYDEVVRAGRGELRGVEAHLHLEDGVYVADDYESLYYLTVFYNFERAILFARDAGDDSAATKEKGVVGLLGTISTGVIPVGTADNAAYVSLVDGWITLGAVTQEGVPFGMSEAVIAHEFSHRLFFQNMYGKNRYTTWRDIDYPQETDDVYMLAGFNEGLADIFAIASLGDASALTAAFTAAGENEPSNPYVGEGERRALDGPFAESATYDNLATLMLDADLLQTCGFTKENFQQGYNKYCIGTVLAKALLEGANNDAVTLRNEVVPGLAAAYADVGAAIENAQVFAPEMMLQAIASHVSADRRSAVCTVFGARFASLVASGSVPACL
jgi:hypothetical protein